MNTRNNLAPQGQQPLIFGAFFAYRDLPAVCAWVSELPLDRPAQVAADLRWPVGILDRYGMTAQQRFCFLEALLAPMARVMESICEIRRKGSYPLSDSQRALVSAVADLVPEYLAGYRQILWQGGLAGLAERWLHGGLQAQAAHRIISLLAQAAEVARLLERPYPSGLWQELCHTMRHAERAGWLEVRMPSIMDPQRSLTMEQECCRLLLSAQIHPGNFNPRTGLEFATAMDLWVGKLRRVAYKGRPPGRFVGFGLLQGVDAPPMALHGIEPARGTADQPNWGLLYNASGLEGEITRLIVLAQSSPHRRVEAGNVVVGLETLLLLRQHWFPQVRRNEVRIPRLGDALSLCIGFENALSLLGEGKPLSAKLSITAGALQGAALGGGKSYRGAAPMVGWRDALLREQSPRGMRVELPARDGMDLPKEGDLVAVSSREGGQARLMEVRWVELGKERCVAGLRLVCVAPCPVKIQLSAAVENRGRPTAALAGVDLEGGQTLVLPPFSEAEGHHPWVHFSGSEKSAQLQRPFIQGNGFSAHRFIAEAGHRPATTAAAVRSWGLGLTPQPA